MNVTAALRNFEFISLQLSCVVVIMVAAQSRSRLGVLH